MNSDQVVKCGSEQIHFPPKAYAFLFLAAVYCKKGHSLNLTKWEQVKQNYLTIYSYFSVRQKPEIWIKECVILMM